MVGSMVILEVTSLFASKTPPGPVASAQVLPPSIDLRMPRPKLESSELLASPVPAYTTRGLLLLTAMAPIDKVFCASVNGIQVVPPLVVFHTLPPADAI